ncbi:hypothetical protein B0H13DRAFT_1869321 [Mycena leptocephala]|nr:hypothetical protein B0H13DRAFT_1869321 [Mycena leptocephala]
MYRICQLTLASTMIGTKFRHEHVITIWDLLNLHEARANRGNAAATSVFHAERFSELNVEDPAPAPHLVYLFVSSAQHVQIQAVDGHTLKACTLKSTTAIVNADDRVIIVLNCGPSGADDWEHVTNEVSTAMDEATKLIYGLDYDKEPLEQDGDGPHHSPHYMVHMGDSALPDVCAETPLMLPEHNLMIEFPPGAMFAIPSAILRHSNVSIQQGEKQFSITQYTSPGIFRFVKNNFKTDVTLKANISKAKECEFVAAAQIRYSEGLKMYSTLDELKMRYQFEVKVCVGYQRGGGKVTNEEDENQEGMAAKMCQPGLTNNVGEALSDQWPKRVVTREVVKVTKTSYAASIHGSNLVAHLEQGGFTNDTCINVVRNNECEAAVALCSAEERRNSGEQTEEILSAVKQQLARPIQHIWRAVESGAENSNTEKTPCRAGTNVGFEKAAQRWGGTAEGKKEVQVFHDELQNFAWGTADISWERQCCTLHCQ